MTAATVLSCLLGVVFMNTWVLIQATRNAAKPKPRKSVIPRVDIRV